jgi:hypothetical protein
LRPKDTRIVVAESRTNVAAEALFRHSGAFGKDPSKQALSQRDVICRVALEVVEQRLPKTPGFGLRQRMYVTEGGELLRAHSFSVVRRALRIIDRLIDHETK